jgi:hypothetical protein
LIQPFGIEYYSIFKHGITEADIRWAIDTAKYDGFLEDAENKRNYGGFD